MEATVATPADLEVPTPKSPMNANGHAPATPAGDVYVGNGDVCVGNGDVHDGIVSNGGVYVGYGAVVHRSENGAVVHRSENGALGGVTAVIGINGDTVVVLPETSGHHRRNGSLHLVEDDVDGTSPTTGGAAIKTATTNNGAVPGAVPGAALDHVVVCDDLVGVERPIGVDSIAILDKVGVDKAVALHSVVSVDVYVQGQINAV